MEYHNKMNQRNGDMWIAIVLITVFTLVWIIGAVVMFGSINDNLNVIKNQTSLSQNLSTAYQQGAYDYVITQNNRFIYELSNFGVAKQNIFYNNQTYSLDCRVKE